MTEYPKLMIGGVGMTADPLVGRHLVGVAVQGLLRHGHHPGFPLVDLNADFKLKKPALEV